MEMEALIQFKDQIIAEVKAALGIMQANTEKRFDMVGKRFDVIDARFDDMDGRFAIIDSRLDGVDSRFDGIDTRFNAVDAHFDEMESRMDDMNLELRSQGVKLEDIDSILRALSEEQDIIHGRVDSVFEKVSRMDSRLLAVELS